MFEEQTSDQGASQFSNYKRERYMGRSIVYWAILICFFLPKPCFANDIGPRKDVVAIRHDLPILIATEPQTNRQSTQPVPPIAVDQVFVEGDWAVVKWHNAVFASTANLQKVNGAWWLQISPGPGDGVMVFFSIIGKLNGSLQGTTLLTTQEVNGYQFTLKIHLSSSSQGAATYIRNITGRRASANAILFFNVRLESSSFGEVSGGTMDVWFPFVLNSNNRYTLSAARDGYAFAPIMGTLKNNSLRFELPAFIVGTGANLTGQIDADAPDYL